MEAINFVLAGLGGQGILFMTKILANTALQKGYNVMGAETHGMAQRGGSVVSHLRLGNVQSSLVKTGAAHFLLALEENEAYRNLPFLVKGGRLFSDASRDGFPRKEVKSYLENMAIQYFSIPAAEMALDLGAPMSTNLALIGYFAAFQSEPFQADDLRKTVQRVSPERFREINLKVFDAGLTRGERTTADSD
jgi:indolepyruvate ferredoxin oxidoreductase beta subunit